MGCRLLHGAERLSSSATEAVRWNERSDLSAYPITLVNKESSARIGLTARCRARECIERKAMRFDTPQRRIRFDGKIVSPRVRELWHEADIGERRRCSVAKGAGAAVGGKPGLDRGETKLDPVPIPGVLCVLARAERTGQIFQHPQVVQGMNVARDRLRDRSHSGPGFGR